MIIPGNNSMLGMQVHVDAAAATCPSPIPCSNFPEFWAASSAVTAACCDDDFPCVSGLPTACNGACGSVRTPAVPRGLPRDARKYRDASVDRGGARHLPRGQGRALMATVAHAPSAHSSSVCEVGWHHSSAVLCKHQKHYYNIH